MGTCIFCATGKHGKCVRRSKGGCPGNCQHRGTKHTLTHPSRQQKTQQTGVGPLFISAADHQTEPIGVPAGVSVGAGLLTRDLLDSATERLLALPDTSGMFTGVFRQGPDMEWIGVPKHVMPELIQEYVKRVETDPTEERCKCEWQEVDTPKGKRKVKLNDHPDCSVHSKEGFIKGFFDWLFETHNGTNIGLTVEPSGPDSYFDNDGTEIHRNCEGEILYFKEGWICSKCKADG